MKVLFINVNCGTQSTGRICADLAELLIRNGDEAEVAYGRDQVPAQYRQLAYHIGNMVGVYSHVLVSRLFDAAGKGSRIATKKLVNHIKEYKPDIIHLHNLHGYYLNLDILFKYLKSANIPVVWTFHDCWPFTGHCSHYDYIKCDKWKTGCNNCPQIKSYPKSLLLDGSTRNYRIKKQLFDIDNLYITTVSDWLKRQVEESFFKTKPIFSIQNGIDLSVYHRFEQRSTSITTEGKINLLAVSSVWSVSKGIKDLVKLAEVLDERFVIYIVGNIPAGINLPNNVVKLGTINKKEELAKIYSSCDLLINLSYQESCGLVPLEAMACGLPVVVYNATSLPEIVGENGKIVSPGDIDSIREYAEQQDYIKPDQSWISRFSVEDNWGKYLDLYKWIVDESD